jgi:hypothetical protein
MPRSFRSASFHPTRCSTGPWTPRPSPKRRQSAGFPAWRLPTGTAFGWRSMRRTTPAGTISATSSAPPTRPAARVRAARHAGRPRRPQRWLIALTGAGEGALARLYADGKAGAARPIAITLQALFGDRLYIEIARRGDPVEDRGRGGADRPCLCPRSAAGRHNPAKFAEPHFHAAHDALLCIANSTHIDAADRPALEPQWLGQVLPMMEELFRTCPRRPPIRW